MKPPAGDRWGPGPRIPALIISPYAKRNFVDHTPIRYDLDPQVHHSSLRAGTLVRRALAMGDLTAAFDFTQ